MISAESKRMLRYVKLPAGEVDMSHFPDFLIAGPQRTGTTWLHRNLEQHPQIFMTEPKELYYFNLLKYPSHPRFCSTDLEWYLRFFRDTPREYMRKQLRALVTYRRPYAPRVRGEGTASYAAMEPELIRELTLLNPRIKVILMVRNPVERAWSHAKKDLLKDTGRKLDEVAAGEFESFFRDDYQVTCADYDAMIANWSSALQPGALFIGMFEEVAEHPDALLRRVCEFLAVRPDLGYERGLAHRQIAETAAIEVPPRYREMLTELFRREIENWEALVRRLRSQAANDGSHAGAHPHGPGANVAYAPEGRPQA
jgi:hypothetical protein